MLPLITIRLVNSAFIASVSYLKATFWWFIFSEEMHSTTLTNYLVRGTSACPPSKLLLPAVPENQLIEADHHHHSIS